LITEAEFSIMKNEGERITALDGIRGIAICAVFLFHLAPFLQQQDGTWLGWQFLTLFAFGWIGVDLFFGR
jgi:peptidoglycan/LPS O-acetylase OafA/YrhL